MKLDTIRVPLDGSALAEAALPRALEAVHQSGARLLLLPAEAHRLPGRDLTHVQIRGEQIVRAPKPADLIVMATHGRRGLPRLFPLGCVAGRVIALAPCPVLTVRGR